MDTPLLQTKLYIPPTRPASGVVPRPRLIERLNESLHRKLTLISAPTGFGKTTIVSDWLRHIDRPAAWLSLDEGDNDLTRFLNYIIAALQQIETGIGQTTHSLLHAPQLSPPEALMTPLINDIAALPKEVTLVLDDYHLIDSQAIHQALSFLLNHLPPHLHLVITTRADPPLPLSRLRAQGQLTELSALDLRFTFEEATAFLNEVIGLELSVAAVTKLEARTEGWIAGLQLAALSMRDQPDKAAFIEAFTGRDRHIVDYLLDEVFNSQTAEVQRFLLQTSVLERLSGDLCDTVLSRGAEEQGSRGESFSSPPLHPSAPLPVDGQVSSQAILEALDQANLFIVPLDSERGWYRYHHLFAELLQHRLQRSRPDLIPMLHRRAAAWYEQNGWVAEAIQHALSAEDYDQAARLIAQNTGGLLKRGEATTLWHWLNKLPPDRVRTDPQLCVVSVWARLLTGPAEGFEAVLEEAEQIVTHLPTDAIAQQQALLAEVQAIRAITLIEQGHTTSTVIQLARQALDDLSGHHHYLYIALITSLALAYRANGDTTAAMQRFTEAQAIAEQSDNIFSMLFTSYELAELYVEHGQLHQAEALRRRALSLAKDRFGPGAQHIPLTGAAHIGLGKLLYERNDLAAAQQHLEQGLEVTYQPGGMGFPREALVALAFLYQALGDEPAATARMRQAQEMAHSAPRPQVIAQIELHHVRLQLAQGQVRATHRWARESSLTLQDRPDYADEMTYLTLLRTILAEGDQTSLLEAIEVTTHLLQRAESQQRWGRAIEILILLALAHQALGQTDQALKMLENALSLAEPEGYVRRFVDEGQAMSDLLQMALARNITPGYTGRLLAAYKAEQVKLITQSEAQPLVEPLTERELEVLNLIAAGLSNKAISDTLFITVGTVKRHTVNIYGKLGVNSRTQAAVKAKALGLIE